MSQNTDALEAISAAEEVCNQTLLKLNGVVELQRELGEDVSQSVRLRTRALQRKQTFTQIRLELEAADVVVRAPTPEEIAAVKELLAKVKQISVEDAAGAAGLKLIADTFDTLDSNTRDVKAS